MPPGARPCLASVSLDTRDPCSTSMNDTGIRTRRDGQPQQTPGESKAGSELPHQPHGSEGALDWR
eukprot:15442095-Alexandrium_andersonii.AAC.1